MIKQHEKWMHVALQEAKKAALQNEVPVGAVVVFNDDLVAKACNQKENLPSPIAHAEIIALHRAAQKLGRWRLTDATLYVTLEPCAMCAGALVQSRIKTVVFGTPDPKAGAVESVFQILTHEKLNHRCEVVSGILREPCSQILSEFFRERRKSLL